MDCPEPNLAATSALADLIRRALALEECAHACLASMMEIAAAISNAMRDRS
jgi:hypothetical protein